MQNEFLAALKELGSVNAACHRCGIWPTTVLRWRDQSKEFSEAVDGIRGQAIGHLEGSMYERAFRNDITGMFMLKALVPETYQEKNQAININVGVAVGQGDWQAAIKAVNERPAAPSEEGQ